MTKKDVLYLNKATNTFGSSFRSVLKELRSVDWTSANPCAFLAVSFEV